MFLESAWSIFSFILWRRRLLGGTEVISDFLFLDKLSKKITEVGM